MQKFPFLFLNLMVLALLVLAPVRADQLSNEFVSPPNTAKPWVYWYFMDGNESYVGIHADLEAMKKAGIGGAIFLEVDVGVPRGPVAFMSQEWQSMFVYAVTEAKRLGLQIALGAGPGWCGTGGPWVTPELSMQDLVQSTTVTNGPATFDGILPRPQPKTPFFGIDTLDGDLRDKWQNYYSDVALIAFPTPSGTARVDDIDHKALYYRASYSSMPGTPPRIDSPVGLAALPPEQTVPPSKVIVLTGKMGSDGHLVWQTPPGSWTIMRLGLAATGQTTRPAPLAGLGFESDKFNPAALSAHLHSYTDKVLGDFTTPYESGKTGLTMLHFDSWEMASQNWSPVFDEEFIRRCGYNPLPYLPALGGYVVGSPEISERFLWDLRHTASDLIVENHADVLAAYAHAHHLTLSIEPYDLNPSADLDLGSAADLPMAEFWSHPWSFPSEFSVFEAVSVGHTNNRAVIGAESFTANPGEDWHQYPGSMKDQLNWALCSGLNKIVIHRYQHQPDLDKFPGMTMGPYGVHWERTETWWSMVPAFHQYISRCCEMLRQGQPVADILYLTPEGAPQVFTPPSSALTAGFPDRKGYNFDGCSPENLIKNATVKEGRIVFPGGMSYRVLVLPYWKTMTPELLDKIEKLHGQGALIIGRPPMQSPSLVGYPGCDSQIHTLAAKLWPTLGHINNPIVVPPSGAAASLSNARWIWFSEGNPAESAPVGVRYFSRTWNVKNNGAIVGADVAITADNSFILRLNGHTVTSGDNFHTTYTCDIQPWIKFGANTIEIDAENTGDNPNPAGVIASFYVRYVGGASDQISTDSTWTAQQTKLSAPVTAMDLGSWNMAPWNLEPAPQEIYPDYSFTSAVLKQHAVAPDFTSDIPLRYTHRRLTTRDIYFVANTTGQDINGYAAFRVSNSSPQWWDPITGIMRPLPLFTISNGLTTIPVQLGAYESGFVVFTKSPAAIKSMLRVNFPRYRTVEKLSGQWEVAFDPYWGGPAHTVFPQLTDWSQSADLGVKYYSGKAVYTQSFDLPEGSLPSKYHFALSLGDVKDLATITVNGHDLGIVWCYPWRVAIPSSELKISGNSLKVTVANLWINRLIGDSGLPDSQRKTSTTGNNYSPNSPLQPSGLLGPVTLQVQDTVSSH